MDPVKVAGLSSWPTPTMVKKVWSFLGFGNFYRRFISNYAGIAQLLHELTKKAVMWEWTAEREQAFQRLKTKFTNQLVLQLSDPDKPFVLETNASQYATGGVL